MSAVSAPVDLPLFPRAARRRRESRAGSDAAETTDPSVRAPEGEPRSKPAGESPSGGRKLAGLRVVSVTTVVVQVVAMVALRMLPDTAAKSIESVATTALLTAWAGATGYMAGNVGEWVAQAWAARGRE